MTHRNESCRRHVLALDLGDRVTTLARREDDKIIHEDLETCPEVLHARFVEEPPAQVVFEAGSQSHWISWMLEDLGHEPLVVHPRRLKMITDSSRKTDRADATWLLLLGESDLQILEPISVRSRDQQADLVRLRTRQTLVRMRVNAIHAVRGHAKLFGCALASGSPDAFPKRARAGLCRELRIACAPLLVHIESLTRSIRRIDAELDAVAERRPETQCMLQVPSIGVITALTFVLTLQDVDRFPNNRQVGAAVGLVPRKRASGMRNPELRITKTGDTELRRLLVLAAHRMMRTTAPDSDIKRFGLRLAERGGKNAKKRAAVAVARKISVLLAALWRSGEVYEPLRGAESMRPAA